MTEEELNELDNGDEVYWTDPDDDPESSCSRVIKIRSIEFKGEAVCIWGYDGSYLECFAHELS
jgi:hypothetical protein